MVNYKSADSFYQSLENIEGEISNLMCYIHNHLLDDSYNRHFIKKLKERNFEDKIKLLSKLLINRINDGIKIK